MPAAAIVGAVLLGIGLPRLDARIDDRVPSGVLQYLFAGDPSAARTVLDAVASSLITVTSLTFSLTVVTLQLASSQFSPRLLRTFTRDVFVQSTLAIFLATFVYALTVLRSVRSDGDHQSAFVPRLSVTISFVLAVASVLGLVLFLAHLAQQIRVETMLRVVQSDAVATLESTVDDRATATTDRGPAPEVPAHAERITAPRSGFLVQVDETALLAAAVDAGAIVLLDVQPGDSVVAGTPIAGTWPASGAAFAAATGHELADRIRAAVTMGFERTATQDIGLGLRQLTDVANKALSPGINDPTTAVHALGHSSSLLCRLAGKELGPKYLRDADGALRVILRRPTLDELVELAVGQPRRYGASDPDVLARLFGLLRELGWCVAAEHRGVVTGQLARLRGTADDQHFDATERDRLTRLARLVDDALEHRWPLSAT